MRVLYAGVLAVFFVAWASSSIAWAQANETYVRAGRMFDVQRGRMVRNQVIVVFTISEYGKSPRPAKSRFHRQPGLSI